MGAESGQDDNQLLILMRAGDEEAFRAFVRRYHRSMIRHAARFVLSAAVAEEVTQETWMAVIRGLGQFEGRSSVRTWVFRILENRARVHGAAERRTTPFSSLEGDDTQVPAMDPARFRNGEDPSAGYWAKPLSPAFGTPDQQVLTAETRAVIEQAIGGLPVRQREVLSLRDIEGWSAREVCDYLGISKSNQRVLLYRARSRVRAVLEVYLAEQMT